MADKRPLTQMPCEEFALLASQRFETPVKLRDRLRMLWHRLICVYCRRLLTQMTRIRSLLGTDGNKPPMPTPMKAAIRKHLEKSG